MRDPAPETQRFFVPDDLVRMDKTHRMLVKKKSAFSIRGYLGCSWRYRCWWKEGNRDRRSDVWKWMCSAMWFFFWMFYGIRKRTLNKFGIFLLWDIEATWYDVGDIFRCVLKLLCFIVWSNDGMGQPIPRQINVQSNLSPVNWRLKNLVLREIAVRTLNGF
jgi:hypothetical protein